MLLIALSDNFSVHYFTVAGVVARAIAGLGTACILTASNAHTRLHYRL
jgi:hypothetical protein